MSEKASITSSDEETVDKQDLPDIELEKIEQEQPAETTQEQEQPDPNIVLEKTLEDAGFDVQTLVKEIEEAGSITPEIVTKLKEKIDPDVIDTHLARLQAEAKAAMQEAQIKAAEDEKKVTEMNDYIYNQVGGEDKFKTMASVLKDNMKPEELQAINDLLASGSKEQVNIAMQAAVNNYNTIKGKGNLMNGDTNTSTNSIQPLSKVEFIKIMSTEKYKTDPDYARQMDQRRLSTLRKEQQTKLPGQYFKRQNGVIVEV